MFRVRARLLPLAVLACLAGQGLLLAAGGSEPGPVRPRVFLALAALGLAACGAALAAARREGRPRAALLLTTLGLLASAVAAPLSRAGAGSEERAATVAARADARLDTAASELAGAVRTLDRLRAEAAAGEAAPPAAWQRRWREQGEPAAALPLEVVVWQEGRRVAWTAGAVPLAADLADTGRTLVTDRQGLVLRDALLRDGARIVFQVLLDEGRLQGRHPGLRLATAPAAAAPGPARTVALGTAGPHLTLRLAEDAVAAAWRAERARRHVALLLAWAVALVAAGWWLAGPVGALAAAWIARLGAVGTDLHLWLSAGWPAAAYPAPPGAPASLVDPAYFATPFAGGLFASTADALLSGVLMALTARVLLGRGRPRSAAASPGRALACGALAGAALLAGRGVVTLLAENANARLIGPGIPVDFLSFWGLHLARLLWTTAPVALVAGLVAARRAVGGWLPAVLAGGAAALVVGLGGASGTEFVLAAAASAALWLLAPLLVATAPLRRRLAWPLVLAVVTVWSYAALREVYGAAATAWLDGRSQLIAAADADWDRFLVGDVLAEMRDVEPDLPADTGLWRDEKAWRLWRGSALRDLGLPCLVAVTDARGDDVSLHATGFLDDYQYEVEARTPWMDAGGEERDEPEVPVFQTERRIYNGGEEEVLVGEVGRAGGAGWLRVETPVRSWRVQTILDRLTDAGPAAAQGYRPRAEIDREVMLWRADDGGLRDAGPEGFPSVRAAASLEALRSGDAATTLLPLRGRRWLVTWVPLPPDAARTPGEGFFLGLRLQGPGETLLDLSRLLLLDLFLFAVGLGLLRVLRLAARRLGAADVAEPWRLGFRERFVGGTFVIGLVLLVLVGAAVDRVRQDQIRAEARAQTRAGLRQATDQLRSLLVEQARSLAASEYIADLLVGQLGDGRPAGPLRLRQAMVFGADGEVLLDETLSDLDDAEAAALLESARRAPLVVVREDETVFVGTVIPIDLGGVMAEVAMESGFEPGLVGPADGFFFYRQRLDQGLLGSLAALVRGELLLRVDGLPVLASDPGQVFAGRAPLLAAPELMAAAAAHPEGAAVHAEPGRPFAPTGLQPLAVFGRDAQGGFGRHPLPGLLEVAFPDRARLFADQRRATALFLAGLVNLVLLAALAPAALMSWSIFRPLRVLVGATGSLARGDYTAPLPASGPDEVGELSGAFARMRDDLRSAQERLAARERFLSAVLDQVTVGVAVLAAGGEVVALNPAGRQILAGYRPGAEPHAAARDLLAHLRAEAGGDARLAGQVTDPAGQRTLRGALAPMELPDGRAHTMLVFEDVTEFLENQRLAINAELARQVAHEIKNPLTPIRLSVQLLRQAWQDEHPDLDRIVAETVERILAQVELLRRIAGEFSLLGRPGELVTEPLDLRALVLETVAAYAGHAGDGAPRVTVDDAAPPPVLGDADSLRKILGNLMQNSLDAVPPGRAARVEVDWGVDAGTVTLRWRDRGTGVPEEVAGRLFDPYFSTKSKGTGLGLAICRNLTDRMGGRITLTNREDGPGAVATLTLRRAEGEEDPA